MFTDENMTAKDELFTWLRHMNKYKGSDLFVTTNFPPAMKVDGTITRITDTPLTAEKCMEIAFSIMSAKQAEDFSSTNECNFAISLPDTSRFRVNAMIQRGATAVVGSTGRKSTGIAAVIVQVAKTRHPGDLAVAG